jgi:hypothetical protein
MRIKKSIIRRIINEELEAVLSEASKKDWDASPEAQQHAQKQLQKLYVDKYESSKKEFINLNVLKKENLEAAVKKEIYRQAVKKGLDRETIKKGINDFFSFKPKGRSVQDIRAHVVSHLKKTSIKFFAPGEPMGTTGLGSHKGGFYSPDRNMIGWANWEWNTFGEKLRSVGQKFLPILSKNVFAPFNTIVMHELGHAKDHAIAVVIHSFALFLHDPRWGMEYIWADKRSFGGAMSPHQEFLNKCFPGVKTKGGKKHEERAHEWYASLQSLFPYLGRNKLIPEDIQLLCFLKSGGFLNHIKYLLENRIPEEYQSKRALRRHIKWFKRDRRGEPKDRIRNWIEHEKKIYNFFHQEKWSNAVQTWIQKTPTARKSTQAALKVLKNMKSYSATYSEPWEYLNCNCDPNHIINYINVEIAKVDGGARKSSYV